MRKAFKNAGILSVFFLLQPLCASVFPQDSHNRLAIRQKLNELSSQPAIQRAPDLAKILFQIQREETFIPDKNTLFSIKGPNSKAFFSGIQSTLDTLLTAARSPGDNSKQIEAEVRKLSSDFDILEESLPLLTLLLKEQIYHAEELSDAWVGAQKQARSFPEKTELTDRANLYGAFLRDVIYPHPRKKGFVDESHYLRSPLQIKLYYHVEESTRRLTDLIVESGPLKSIEAMISDALFAKQRRLLHLTVMPKLTSRGGPLLRRWLDLNGLQGSVSISRELGTLDGQILSEETDLLIAKELGAGWEAPFAEAKLKQLEAEASKWEQNFARLAQLLRNDKKKQDREAALKKQVKEFAPLSMGITTATLSGAVLALWLARTKKLNSELDLLERTVGCKTYYRKLSNGNIKRVGRTWSDNSKIPEHSEILDTRRYERHDSPVGNRNPPSLFSPDGMGFSFDNHLVFTGGTNGNRENFIPKPSSLIYEPRGSRVLPKSPFLKQRLTTALNLIGGYSVLPRGVQWSRTDEDKYLETDDKRVRISFDPDTHFPTVQIHHPTHGQMTLTSEDWKALLKERHPELSAPAEEDPPEVRLLRPRTPKVSSRVLEAGKSLVGAPWGEHQTVGPGFRIERRDPEVWIHTWKDRLVIRYHPGYQQTGMHLVLPNGQTLEVGLEWVLKRVQNRKSSARDESPLTWEPPPAMDSDF